MPTLKPAHKDLFWTDDTPDRPGQAAGRMIAQTRKDGALDPGPPRLEQRLRSSRLFVGRVTDDDIIVYWRT